MDKWLKTGTLKNDLPAVCSVQVSSRRVSQGTSQEMVVMHVSDSSKTHISSTGAYQKKRKYSDEYLKYGLSITGEEESPNPLCVVCGEVLSNGSMKPSVLMCHLNTKHAQYKKKEVSFFE